jgi:hypothetical protein
LRAGDGLERGGLAGAVGADQADQFPREDLEADTLDGLDAAMSIGNSNALFKPDRPW